MNAAGRGACWWEISPVAWPLQRQLATLNRGLTWILLAVIGAYRRWVSPLLPPRCRFTPSCSAYGLEAISRHGPWRGGWLAIQRICRCHPFSPCGCDPVPD